METIIKLLKSNFKIIILSLITILAYAYSYYMHTHPIIKTVIEEKVVTQEVIKEVVKQSSETTLSVQRKQKEEDADIVCNTKSSIKVNLNGKDVELKPDSKEGYTFGKDFVKLNQENIVSLSIDQKPLEPTLQFGVGYTSNRKVSGIVVARIKKTPFHVWGMSDGHTHAGGLMFSTNFK